MIYLIAAVSRNNKIGKDGKLPWHIPEDLKYFKSLTQWHTILMGRKTYESIGYPLPNRYSIILTRDTDFHVDSSSAEVCHSIDDALTHFQALYNSHVFVIGGGEIYKQLIPYADKLYLTMIDKDIEGDTDFPSYKEDFMLESIVKHNDELTHYTEDDTPYQFTVWQRNPKIG